MSFFEDDPLRNLFHTVASSSAARAAAATAASVQVEHYNQLVAEGMDPDKAIDLTARTSASLFEAVAGVVGHISANGRELAAGIEKLVETVEKKR